MITVVDRANGHVIQKVTNTHTGKLLRYQTVPDGVYDASQSKEYPTLVEARDSIGHRLVGTVKLTRPKFACPQNMPGYRADSKAKAKK